MAANIKLVGDNLEATVTPFFTEELFAEAETVTVNDSGGCSERVRLSFRIISVIGSWSS